MDFKNLWESIPYPGFVLSKRLKILSANSFSEHFCGTSLPLIVGKKLNFFIAEDSSIFDILSKVKDNSAAIVKFDLGVRWKKRGVENFDMYAISIDGGASILLLLHPKSFLDKMDRALISQNATKSVSAMGSILSHEIKNPLASIFGAAQLLQESSIDNKETLISIIIDETKRIESLIDRVELLGEVSINALSQINIHDVLDKVKRNASEGYGSHIQFVEDYDPSIPLILGDFELLIQAFHNLFKNACESVKKKGGKIFVKTSFHSGIAFSTMGEGNKKLQLKVSIADNGPGVSKNILSDIFDPFSTTKLGGSGLGLSIVSKIILEHGGIIELDDVKEGACFNVYLPVFAGKKGERLN